MKQWSMIMLLISAVLFARLYASSSINQPLQPSPSFIVQPSTERQPKSTQGIKEAMGDSLENIIRQCASLQQELAQLHIQLSNIQTHALSSVRNLIDNTGPIKSSKKDDLRHGLSVLQSTEQHLYTQLQTTKVIGHKLSTAKEKPGESLQQARASMKEQRTLVTQVHHDLVTAKSFKRS